MGSTLFDRDLHVTYWQVLSNRFTTSDGGWWVETGLMQRKAQPKVNDRALYMSLRQAQLFQALAKCSAYFTRLL